MSLKIDVSVGELLDKITILEIKTERIRGQAARSNVQKELGLLRRAWDESRYGDSDVAQEVAELKRVNERLWEIEDDIRRKEEEAAFDEEFVELARSVYKQNDRRAAIKRTLNQKLGSDLTEEKSYTDYSSPGIEPGTVQLRT